ncbi:MULTISPECIES: glycerophosphodiester phosphodiesterase family protein [Asticcacaulis]|uniref:glycerophosphodiester phosphodiesterase family protein n=1 Tax=Asticcacaulis TaxID=76890 RepID=UPI001AE67D0D|nr:MULTISPECIES: glycerophosphodiester phosphodiesterase family protein [Asticcacaulis]MBP2157742.1 glycerophosphoryl diester phosphodiesterase [Asticcacaulis solisilvae]MDR6798787.1 glycerophosphoryl diester phosphodiesterase [Asticcacaulis sp. BE141]
MNRRQLLTTGAAALTLSAGHATAAERQKPLVIAHRGASGYLPEHTLPAYEMAIKMGADYIEPDVVSTRDGVLVVRHDPVLTDSTDILKHPEFADRKRTLKLGAIEITDFFVSDFTLAEIKTLRATQVFADRSHAEDGKYEILTLAEVIDLAQARARDTGRVIGIAPEIKLPTLHRMNGLGIEEKLVAMLDRAGWNKASSPVIIQSFEQGNLKALRKATPVRLLQLVSGSDIDAIGNVVLKAPDDRPFDWAASGRAGTYADLLTPEGLKEVGTYADYVASWKRWLMAPVGTDMVRRPEIVANAHAAGLKVITWTLRNDRLDAYYKGDTAREYLDLFGMGVDGVFSDFTDTAVAARNRFAVS